MYKNIEYFSDVQNLSFVNAYAIAQAFTQLLHQSTQTPSNGHNLAIGP